MPCKPYRIVGPSVAAVLLLGMGMFNAGPANAAGHALASDPPERCAGYGALESISLSDWEGGLGAWSAVTHDVASQANFATPDWAVVGNLPDGRPGMAAFVADIDTDNCLAEDQTGALGLDSPTIFIPAGTEVPRISIDHWFETEPGWDGGQFRISVNGGPFTLIPASAIELKPYNAVLEPPLDEFNEVWNSNPFAGQAAFSGTDQDYPNGRWIQSRINLLGLAGAGDDIRLRIDFGIDCGGGDVGWFVDEVEFYSCEAELPPSNCGDGLKMGNEECDDGNDFIGDGCSNTCDVETGWVCAAPTPAGDIQDPSFENGTPNNRWDEYSTNPFGSPICRTSVCGFGAGTGPSDGTWWAWFGGVKPYQQGSLSQTIGIPTTATELTFDLEVPVCDSPQDYLDVLIDGNPELRIDGTDPRCGQDGYVSQSVDISAYADGGSHDLEFFSETFSMNGSVSNFFVDVVAIPGTPSACRRLGTSLTLIKGVVNNDGGTASASEWTLSAAGPSGFSGSGPVVHSSGGFSAGTYHLAESGGPPGYQSSDWACSGGNQIDGDTVEIAFDEAVVCTIINDDAAPTLTVFKNVLNNNGGPVTDPNVFKLAIDGVPVLHNQPVSVDVGDHRVSETPQPNYVPGSWTGDCNPDGTIQLTLGQSATCSITNDDVGPTLKIVKSIVNDDGGTVADPNAFGLRIDGDLVPHNQAVAVSAGPHTLSEDGLPGYQAGAWGGDCNANGTIDLELAENATCTLVNDDIEPSLTLVKQVVNNHGGTALPSAWTLTASGPAGFSGSGPTVSSGPGFLAGTYDLSESGGPSGYGAGGWVCVGGSQSDSDTITVGPGQAATCTITNDDIAPTITLLKNIVNNNGGSVVNPDAFGLRIDGVLVPHNQEILVQAGNHTVSEDGLPGYQPGAWGGDCSAGGSISLALAEEATCTISNDDIPPTLTVFKTIVNDDEGTVTDPNAFGLKVDGLAVLHNVSNPFSAGAHLVSEDGLEGYVAGNWGGDCNADGSISLSLAQNATCTITNDDVDAVTLTLELNLVNNHGGTAVPSQWTLTATGPSGFGGPGPSASSPPGFAPGSYDLVLSDGAPSYASSFWTCNDGMQVDGDTIVLEAGDEATCTITVDDIPPTLKIVNTVINDDGGTVTNPSEFGLRVDGFRVFNNQTNALPAGAHVVSQDGLPGYAPGTWGGDCAADGSVTLILDEDAVCTISNDDIAPTLTVSKIIINDDGGAQTDPNAFQLMIDGEIVQHDAINVVAAGPHQVSEAGLPGYQAGSWEGDCNADGSIILALAQDAACTITNDDNLVTSLVLIKSVINDNGGAAAPSDWTLSADGNTAFSGAGPMVFSPPNFQPGEYSLSESDGPPGYAASGWTCVGGSQVGNTVTLLEGETATCTITNNDIAPTLTVLKTIINDNGGTVTNENQFGLKIDGMAVSHGAVNVVDAGAHLVSEVGLPGYVPGDWGGDCNADGSIMLDLDQDATCTITNDDGDSTSLTLVKNVVNDNGGTAAPSAWTLTASGPSGFSDNGPIASSGPGFSAGTYDLSESGPTGYQASVWECEGALQLDGDTVTLELGDTGTCTITNNDISPTLTVVKTIVNNNGGTVSNPNLFGLQIDGAPVVNGISYPVDAGPHTVSEVGLPGYNPSAWGGDCSPGGGISLALGQHATCTIVNDDAPPSLTLVKTVTNDDGGTASPSAWTLTATGPTGFSGAGPSVSNGAGFKAGIYNLSESGGVPGYAASNWVCSGGNQLDADTISLALGQSATCTITNDDIAPSLTLLKTIVNNNGGTVTNPDAFGLKIDGTPVNHGADNAVSAGNHVVSEQGLPGYQPGPWGGDCDPNGNITLSLGQNAACTITNDDIQPALTLNKSVVNDHGGTAGAGAWTLSAAGPTGFSGPGPTVSNGPGFKAGVYNLSESAGPAGYAASNWVCIGGNQNDADTITIGLGETASCTITNNDIAASVRVLKSIVNDNGGNVTDPNAFGLRVDGVLVQHNVPKPVASGVHEVTEDGLSGYTAGQWGGDCGPDGSVELALAEQATCTITNNDALPRLTLVKQVTNDNGGTAVPSNWTLTATGPTGISGSGPIVSSGSSFEAGTYDLFESGGPDGYSSGPWVCIGGTQNDANTVTVAPGQSATCKITNDDVGASLTLVKEVINNNGGSALAADWTLAAAGPTGFSGAGPNVSSGAGFVPGTYDLSESGGPAGYTASAWNCVGGNQSDTDTIIVALGDTAICTITNDDEGTGLTLVKQVVNDDGGTAGPADWTLIASGPSGFSGPGPSVSSGSGFLPGSYQLSEADGPAGYTAGAWNCQGGTQDGDTIDLEQGQSATCTIINDDQDLGAVIFSDGFESN